MINLGMGLKVLCFMALVLPILGQSNGYFIQKAENFIKNFHAQLNNIHNNAFSVVNLENEAIAIVLDEMIKDRDQTLLYDNVSKSYITNNYISAQKYMDSYQAYFKDRLNNIPGVFSVQCTFGEFKFDTVYTDSSGLNKVCMISRVVNIHYINELEKKLHRSDTISFFVLFEKGNPNARYIIGSEKYQSLTPAPKALDTDGDGISNKRDSCILLPGTENCNGCPDTDLDGICDKVDQCSDKSGPIECNGCPDTDGDGICDLEDLCPIDKGSAINHGCPDNNLKEITDKTRESSLNTANNIQELQNNLNRNQILKIPLILSLLTNDTLEVMLEYDNYYINKHCNLNKSNTKFLFNTNIYRNRWNKNTKIEIHVFGIVFDNSVAVNILKRTLKVNDLNDKPHSVLLEINLNEDLILYDFLQNKCN